MLGPIQQAWVDALPKYTKGRGGLLQREVVTDCDGNLISNEILGYCCLGVFVNEQLDTTWVRSNFSLLYDYYENSNSTQLSSEHTKLLGLHSRLGEFQENGKIKPIKLDNSSYNTLSDVNDLGPFKYHTEMAAFITENANLIFKEVK